MSSPKQNWYALRVTIGYAIAAILWIFFSDQWLTYLTDFDTVRKLSTGKGIAFVLVTSALLYFTLRTASANGRPLARVQNTGMSWPLLTVFVILAATIAGIGLATFRFQSNALRANALTGLQAVAELKVDGISRWLEERRANARSLSGSPVVLTTLARWLESGTADDRAQLTGLLLNLRETYSFSGIAIFDPSGRPLLAEPADDGVSPATPAVMAAAFASKQPLFLDIAHREQGAPPVLGFIAPLYAAGTGGKRGPPMGAIRLELRPEDFLYPFLASWPLHSASGETLIARRDGDDA
ncbi:MAG: cache domain-containing protein, partial [Rhodospirillaceae bacterium]